MRLRICESLHVLAICLFTSSLLATSVHANGWGETYTSLQETGWDFTGNVTQFGQGVVGGGKPEEPDNLRYGGHGDYLLNVDAGRLGLQEGLFFRLRAEHRFGETTTASNTGSPLPTSIAANLPAETDHLYITNFVATQALSENFAVFMGKFDTLDGDQNAFAHGRGITQFSNLAMVINPVAISGSPYSTLGAGFAVLQDREPIFVFTLMNATDTTRTTGFDELFAEGVLLSAGLRLPTNFFGLPGHQSFSGLWNSREYTELVSDPRASAGFDANQTVFPLNKPVNGNYALLYNFDQYLAVDKHGRGWGLFGRAGLGDQRVNPLAYFLSAGIGGNNMWSRSRRNDSFGIGWYYLGATENASLLDALDDVKLKDGQGVEMYYDFAVCSFANLTLDYQWIQAPSSLDAVSNPASILGFRLNILL